MNNRSVRAALLLFLSASLAPVPAAVGSTPPAGPAQAVETVEVKPRPCRVPGYDQEVLCATYPVWENRETRQGRKIGLNIVILPALEPAGGADEQPAPVFELAGGPGQGITDLAGWFARSNLRRKRDIVLIDQRGTGRSNPLHCSFYGEPVDLRIAAGDMLPVDAVEKCRQKLEKVADLSQYTTAAFADDLDEVRQWLGYGKVNLSGGSYGTRVAQVYWRRHPATVRSVLLVGTAPLDSHIPLAHAAAGQRALDLLLAECASQPECRAAFPDTRADLKTVKERIGNGVTVAVADPVTGEKVEVRPSWGLVAEGMRFLMYGGAAAGLPLQIRTAAQGDLEPLVQMALERRLAMTEGLNWGLNFSVTCAEDLPFITDEMIREQTAGTYLGDYRIRQQQAACEAWPRGKVAAGFHEPVRSDLPVLLISGERDPVTPPELAEQASRFMTNRLHVIVPRGSHGVDGECTDNLIRDFIDRASVEGLDPSCAARESKPTRFTMAAPTGPVAAVETRPYPCRVPGHAADVLCATYPVWEDRETKRGRKIGLNIVILPATGPDKEPDPIFELGGGPGQGIVGNAAYIANGAGRALNEKRDIVLVDQRGTGGSNPLHCTFYGEPLDLRLAAGDMLPLAAVERCREKLEKVADLSRYTTAAFADDLDEVRQWLGYGKVNLSGGSYGTRSAQVYWRRHPETVRSVVLVGTLALDAYLPVEHAPAAQRALDLLLAECASQPACRAAYPDIGADLETVRERIERGVTVTVTNPVTEERQEVRPTWGLVAEGMRFLMYGDAAAGLPLQIRKAAQGDLEPLIQMAIDRRLGITDGLDWGLNFSVSCAEDLPFITEEMTRRKTAGTYLGDYRIRQQKAVCEIWPRGRIAADTHEPVRSDVPVLLISGERDPVTPPELAERASRFMTNRLHVVVPRGSHGVEGECMAGLVRDFIDRASVQGLDPSCAATIYGPTEFAKP